MSDTDTMEIDKTPMNSRFEDAVHSELYELSRRVTRGLNGDTCDRERVKAAFASAVDVLMDRVAADFDGRPMPNPELDAYVARNHRQVETAIHEAGHAVAARCFARRTLWMTVDPDGKSGGMVQYSAGARGTQRETLREDMVITAAGPEANKIFNPLSLNGGGSGDAEILRDTARKLHGQVASIPTLADEIDTAHRRAHTLMRQNWRHVEAVALSMIRHHDTLEWVPTGMVNEDLKTLDWASDPAPWGTDTPFNDGENNGNPT